MAHDIDLAELRKIRAIARQALIEGLRLNIAPRRGKSAAALFAFFPQQRLVENQTGGAWIFFHDLRTLHFKMKP